MWFNNSELFFDEAQYWAWSETFEFGYFSKPPLLAWIIAITTGVFDSNSEFFVRLAAPVLHTGTAVVVYLTAQKLFDEKVAFWSGLSYALLPAVTLSSTIISTDVPLLFCWSLALLAYANLIKGEDFSNRWLLLLLLAIGFGLNAKYAMAYFIGCAFVHLIFCRSDNPPAGSISFWLAALAGFAMLIPNVLWNLENDFVTASHTAENIGWDGFSPNWTGFLDFFGSQFGVFGPIMFGMYIATLWSMRRDTISESHRMLVAFSLPVLVTILAQAIISKAYANWAAVTYIAATILVVEILVNRVPWGWMRTTLSIHGVTFVLITVAVCFAGPGQLNLPSGIEPFKRTQGAAEIADKVRKQLEAFEYNAVVTTNRRLSALMHYNLRQREESKLAWRFGDMPKDHFELEYALQDSLRDPILVVSHLKDKTAFGDDFETVELLESADISAGEIERVYLFKLEGHKKFQ